VHDRRAVGVGVGNAVGVREGFPRRLTDAVVVIVALQPPKPGCLFGRLGLGDRLRPVEDDRAVTGAIAGTGLRLSLRLLALPLAQPLEVLALELVVVTEDGGAPLLETTVPEPLGAKVVAAVELHHGVGNEADARGDWVGERAAEERPHVGRRLQDLHSVAVAE
jgi:hypothetical protein